MTYFQGFLIPVRHDDKTAYLAMAAKAAPVFLEYGALRSVECWGDDVMHGKVTDLRRAVHADADENVVFSWVWWPDRAACDGAAARIMEDERMRPDGPMPFDPQRMIYAGFEADFDSGDGGRVGYVDGIVASVTDGDRQAYAEFGRQAAGYFREVGALRSVDGWGADVPDGKVTDFRRAVQAKPGEAVVFGWVEWPDKATRERGMGALVQNSKMAAATPPWNGQLAIFGGFVPILDTDHPAQVGSGPA